MADLSKFEEMLEKLVNEDRKGAEELFHDIVVEKSRQIYENLLENDLEEEDKEVDEASKDEEVDEASKDEEVDEASKDEEVDEATDEEVDESADEEVDEASKDDEEAKENFDLEQNTVTPEADPMDMGDDFEKDVEMDMDDEEDGDGDTEEEIDGLKDQMADLQKELDAIKAEFEAEKEGGDDEGDDEDAADMDMDADDEGDDAEEESINTLGMEATDEEVDEASKEEVDEATAPKSSAEQMREYVEKVTAKMGDGGDNTKSPVASANNMGGTSANIAKGGDADTKGTTGGLEGNSPKEENMGNVNVPGGKASKSMKNMPKGHGAEKKSAGEQADNKKSTIGS